MTIARVYQNTKVETERAKKIKTLSDKILNSKADISELIDFALETEELATSFSDRINTLDDSVRTTTNGLKAISEKCDEKVDTTFFNDSVRTITNDLKAINDTCGEKVDTAIFNEEINRLSKKCQSTKRVCWIISLTAFIVSLSTLLIAL